MRFSVVVAILLTFGSTVGCDGPRKRAIDPARGDAGGGDGTQFDGRSGSDGPVQIPDALLSDAGTYDTFGASADAADDVVSTEDAGRAMTSVAVCGNGMIEAGEQCDPPGTCPTSCPNRACTRFTLEGSPGACTARCVEVAPQTACTANDGCCPGGCNATSDSDCAIKCDNGIREGQETCDPLSSCPTSCPPTGCQLRKLVNQGTCAAACVPDQQQVKCVSSDGCCPAACNNTNDLDCTPKCDNSVVESGETCDPPSQCASRSATCASTKDVIRSRAGDPTKCTFRCEEMPRPCGPADGQCPSGCSTPADPDCRRANGEMCTAATDCVAGFCVGGVCCNAACNDGCKVCNLQGKVGVCSAPAASELCGDRKDNNCSGEVDEGCARITVTPSPATLPDPGCERTTGDPLLVKNTGQLALRISFAMQDPPEPNTCGFFLCARDSDCVSDQLLQPGQSCPIHVCGHCTGINAVPNTTYIGAHIVNGCYELDSSCGLKTTVRTELRVARRSCF